MFACPLDHGTVSLGYVVREHDRQNIDLTALSKLGLKPGTWLKAIKDQAIPDDQPVETGAGNQFAGDLRRQVLVTQPGDSIAYLTDFLLKDQDAEDRLVEMLQGCRTMVCENNYADADSDLAKKNFHMTSSDVGRLAADSGGKSRAIPSLGSLHCGRMAGATSRGSRTFRQDQLSREMEHLK